MGRLNRKLSEVLSNTVIVFSIFAVMDNVEGNNEALGQSYQNTNSPSAGHSHCSGHPPSLTRRKSWYTHDMKDKLLRQLKFFFMGPHEKIRAKRRIPWKLMIQIAKIVLVTAQVGLIFLEEFGTK